MTTYRDVILGPLDIVRGVGGLLGLRVYTVSVLVRTWDGPRPGVGFSSDVTTQLTNALPGGGRTPVHVKQVSRRDVIASGGVYADRDVRVGPLTPPYPAGIGFPTGGFDDATADPAIPVSQKPVEIFWNVVGPGWPVGTGGWAEKVGEEFTALHLNVILRATGRSP